jgi:hypothetical protein
MSCPCEIYDYSFALLLDLFSRSSEMSRQEIEAKLHAVYFREYFSCIGAKTIVVENQYVDHDYLEDYAEYYVRCFQDYQRKCTRLHFFKLGFSSEDFHQSLLNNSDPTFLEQLQANYLGFIVLKPLPRTIIGRTCLITYAHEGRRYFPVTRCYAANLYGLSLKIPNSLAFQEQDSVVAACATSALWSIFQATGQIFQHSIPSPSAITNNATEILTKDQRALPSRGLTSTEMAQAIKYVGLEPLAVKVLQHYHFKTTLYAYLRAKIPMMFGFSLFDISGQEPQYVGHHAVAITGYSEGLSQASPLKGTGFLLRSTRIDKIYVHDDQVGPFSRMVFDGKEIEFADGSKKPSIQTSWRGNNGVIGGKRAISDILLIPVYHKIRIPFGVIHDLVHEFDYLLKKVLSAVIPDAGQHLQLFEWDIYLCSVNDLKESIIRSENLNEDVRRDVLLQSFPRFIWHASLTLTEIKLILLFDATDIEQGKFFIRVIEFDSEFCATLRNIFGSDGIDSFCGPTPAWPIIEWFRSTSSP